MLLFYLVECGSPVSRDQSGMVVVVVVVGSLSLQSIESVSLSYNTSCLVVHLRVWGKGLTTN